MAILVLLALLCCSIIFHAIKGQKRMLPLDQAQLDQNSTAALGESSSFSIDSPSQPQCALKYSQRKKSCNRRLKGSCESLANLKSNNKINSNSNLLSNNGDNQTPSNLCLLCGQKLDNAMDPDTTTWTDEEVREMYQKFKLYSIPTEMKGAPTPDNLIGFLSTLYNGVSAILANTLP